MPARKSPRNFTISADSVRKPLLPGFTAVLRFASVAAAVLLIASLALDFLSPSPPQPASRAAENAAPEMLAMEAPAEADGEEPPIIFWGAPAPMLGVYGKGGGGEGPATGIGGGGDGPGFQPPAGLQPEAALPSESLPQVEESAPPEGIAPQELPEEEILEMKEALTGSGPILGVRPSEELGEAAVAEGIERLPAEPGLPVSLRIVQIVLAGLLLLTAIPAWLMRRK